MFGRRNTKSSLILPYISILKNHPMKKIYVLTLAAIALIYSSCTVEKRHYMSGYHVEWNHKAPKIGGDGNTTAEAIETPKNFNQAENNETTTAQNSVTYVNSLEKNITSKAATKSGTAIPNNVASNSNEKIVVKNDAIKESNNKVIAPLIMNSTNTSQSVANHESSDTDLLILVILAILIPPLAVYLKDGSWGTRSWIALLLWLLFIIPGVIYALLVVLDAI